MGMFAGTGTLFRFVLRRDRVFATAWVGFLLLLILGVAKQYAGLLPTDRQRADFAADVTGNAALNAFTGQLYGHDLGNLTMWKIGDIAFTLIGLMAVLTVIRHTRAEEESGRAELVAAGVVGRFAPLTATLLATIGISLLTGALTTAGLIGFGLDVAGSLTFGLALAMPGCVYAAVAAVAAQLTERAGPATAVAAATLGAGYLIRFVADGSGVLWLRWFSPTGWGHLMQPFAGDRWWVVAAPVAAVAVTTALAYRLAGRRDLGAGTLPPRPGPAEAAPSLRGPLALAWRQHRGQLLGWTAALTALAAAAAGVAQDMPEITNRAGEQIQELFRRYAATPDASLADTFLWMIMVSIGGIAALYPLLATLRLRGEETSGRADLTLSTGVPRLHLAASHLTFAVAGPAVMLTSAGLAAGFVHGLTAGDLSTQLPRVLAAALVQIPPIWAVGSIAMLALGLLPRLATGLAWAVFLLANVFGEALGPILGIEYRVANQIVPFHHVPKVITGGGFTVTPLLVLTAVAVALAGVGFVAFRRRDLT